MTDQCIATSETLNKLLAEEVLRAKKNNLKLHDIHPSVLIMDLHFLEAYGVCIYSPEECFICINNRILNFPEEELRSLIAHEVCHAVYPPDGHGPNWQNAVKTMQETYNYMYGDFYFFAYSKNVTKEEEEECSKLPHSHSDLKPTKDVLSKEEGDLLLTYLKLSSEDKEKINSMMVKLLSSPKYCKKQ